MSPYVTVYTLPSGTQAQLVPLTIPDHFAVQAHHQIISSAYIIQRGQRRRWHCARCAFSGKHGYAIAEHAIGTHLQQARGQALHPAFPRRRIPAPGRVSAAYDHPYLVAARQPAPRVAEVSLQTQRSWLHFQAVEGLNTPRTLPWFCRAALLHLLAHLTCAEQAAA